MQRIYFLIIAFLVFNTHGNGQSDSKETNTQKVKVVGHAHMDPVYRWRWNEIENREIYKTFSDVLDVLHDYPELQFAQSSLLFYATIQNSFPELFSEVKQSIQDNRWSVVGGQWVETDESMPSGESLIRQFLIARDYYSKNLEIENISVAWSPDVFTGHPGTIPKIYAGCGIQNYVFSRDAPDGKKIFWWESKDGSRILGYKIPGHYNPDFRKMPEYIVDWIDISGYELPMITVGKGDHGGGPGNSDFRALKMLTEKANLEFEYESPEDYFASLNDADNNWPVQKMEFGIQPNGERWLGCYTSQAKIKKLNRYFENQLLAAEKFSAIGTLHKGKPFYPREDFLEAWKILLFNQFHDIIPGTLTGLGVNDAYKDYEKLERITSEQLNAGLENIGNRINIEMEGVPLVVYNPHSWPVSQVVEADINFVKVPAVFSIKDPSGKNVPYTVIEKSADELDYKISISGENIPPMGYEVFEIIEENGGIDNTDLTVANNQIENSHYVIKMNESGISSIFSKSLQKEILKGEANKLQLLEDNGSSWSMKLTGKKLPFKSIKKPGIAFQSPQQVIVKWEDYFQNSKIIRHMIVHANSNQIDFEMEVDWHSPNKLLQVIFPTTIEKGNAFYDQSYGYVQRAETGLDFPTQKWIDYSNANFGVALLNNGKYGFSMRDGALSMSVVRGARDMDPRMDEGKHTFKYSIIVHQGDWKDADIPLRAWELNQPLIAKQENQHPGQISGWKFSDQSFPLRKSFFGIDSDHVIISSLKTKQDAYNPNPLILRIVETEGRDEDITVNLPYNATSVVECNHLEMPIESRSSVVVGEKQFSFKIGHDQIRTFMVHF